MPRMNKVINRSLTVDFLFYITIAVVGFFSQFEKTNPIVLERELLPGHEHDYAIVIAIIAICLCLVCAFPTYFNPFRQAFFTQTLGRNEFSNKENFFFTFFMVMGTCTISILFPNIKSVISIMGGLLAIQISFFIPTVIYVSLSEKRWYAYDNLSAIIFFGFLCLTGYGSVVVTIYTMVNDIEMMPRWK